MKKVIRYVRHKNVKKIPDWQRVNPTFSNPRTSTHMRYMNIIGNTMGGATDEEDEQLQNKIIRKVVPEVTIPKTDRFKIVYSTRNDK
jgi:ABC-type sulfate transport system substrate-binding protein